MTVLLYILLCLIWGSTWIAIKLGLTDAPPITTAALRFCVAVTLVLILSLVRRVNLPATWPERIRLGLPGLFMFGFNYSLVYSAEVYIPSSLTAVLFGSFPFWVALFSLGLLKQERLHWLSWFGIGIGFSGVGVISFDQAQLSDDLLLGSLLALGGCAAAAFGTVLHKRYHTEAHILGAILLQMIFGGLFLLPAALLLEQPGDFAFTRNSVGSVLYLAAFGTVAAFLMYFWLIRRMKAITLSLIAFVTPIVAILIGVLLFAEPLSIRAGIGTALILSGVILVVQRRRPPDPTGQFPRQ